MNLQKLKSYYQQDNRTAKIIKGLQENSPCNIHLKGITGSAGAFIASSISSEYPKTNLFVLSGKEEAAYFLNDMENLIGAENVLFFPASYKHHGEIDKNNALLRAEVLNRINSDVNVPFMIITYPEALREKVVSRKYLNKNTLRLSKGEKVSMDFITELLFEYGFEHTDFVIEPGQFSLRGGIVDVFSFSNDRPYRIEFLGDEVVSIRTFDPSTQTSIEKLSNISIIPDIQERVRRDETGSRPYIPENCESFLKFIPQGTILWFKDFQLTIDKLQTDKEAFINDAKEFSIIESGNQFYFEPHITINYHISPQPAFNKNFELLTNNLTENTERAFKNIILTDNHKQIERLNAIFEDIAPASGGIDFTSLLLPLNEGFIDKDMKIACYTDHQIFDRHHRFNIKEVFKKEAITLKEFYNLKPGDYIVHIDHGIGEFAGLEKIDNNGISQEAIRIIYKDGDILYVSIHSLHRISKYSGKEGFKPKLNRLGSGAWNRIKQNTKNRVKDIAKDLIRLYAERKAQKGFEFSPDTYMQNELEASFIYEDTPDQLKATRETKKDMESSSPMDRLICGDVGFGKTEVAIRAAFKAVADSKQVAVLLPTTILALQHYKTFKERLAGFPCNIDYLNRLKSVKQQKETLKKLANGQTDMIIGTHRIVSKDVKFKDLGLLIIDEEQKFGVATKEKLKSLKVNVDTLTLTATPIPRTLRFSLMGARDMSVINTPPPNRYPIQTELHIFNKDIIRDAILNEVSRDGQVFFVHNRVQNIEEVAGMVKRICPDVRVAVGHGQMEGAKLEKVMIDFIEGKYDVLVATTIIESGLDIPNANTIIIDNAHHYGLSDLHQMRGRVGRSNKKAFCYLFTPPHSMLTAEARKRLKAIEDFSDLGSGFNIALRDLDIRGAGNMLGAEQSGFIADLGFDMYHKILDEAISELKNEEFPELTQNRHVETRSGLISKEKDGIFVKDCQVDTDLEVLIPDDYVNNITERLRLYKDLNDIKNEEGLLSFKNMLIDRFGILPKQTEELLNTIRLRWLAKEAGFEKIVIKKGVLIGYFVSEQNSPYYQSSHFTRVLDYVQQHLGSSRLKESKNKLSISLDGIDSINDAIRTLTSIVKESSVLV